MKYLLCVAVLVLSAAQVGYAQFGNIGIGTTTPDPSSKLDITSDTSGVLIPRMTDVQRDAIMNPATGLMVFVTTDSLFYYYDGSAWTKFSNRTTMLSDADADTRVYVEKFPDEDRIRFDVAGSEAMTIDMNGNVGIGTTSPDGSLQVESSDMQTEFLINNTGIGDPVLGFQLSGASQYTMGIDDNDGDKFKLTTGGVLDSLDVLTIDQNGYVGIGTTSPNQMLDVNGIIQSKLSDSYDKIRVHPASFYTIGMKSAQTLGFLNSHAMTFTMFDNPAYGWLWRDHNDASTDGAMSLTSDGRLYVKSTAAFNGNVGVGTTTPSAKLDVVGDAEFNGVIESGLTDSYDKIRVYPNPNYTIGMKSAQTLGFLNDWATTFTMDNNVNRGWLWRDISDIDSDGAMSLTSDGRLYVKSTAAFNGNVGIGTTSPLDKLHVASPGQAYIRLENTSSGVFSVWASNSSIPWIGTTTANRFSIVTNGLFRLTVNETGNVGIGTTVPTQRLDVIGNAAISGYLTTLGGIHVGGTSVPGTDDLIVDGMIGIGTTTPTETLDVNGTARIGSGGGGGGLLDVIGDGGTQGNIVINRVSTDGMLIRFRRDGITQGSIDISGPVVSYNAFTGSHYAGTDEILEPGTLVAMTGQNKRCGGDPHGEIIYGISASTLPNSPAILGAYLAPEIAGDTDDDRPHLVMSVGNGEMWVADMGENIEIGDYLISSAVPGHAMKDHGDFEISYIIARAAESIDWDLVNETMHGVKRKKISVLFENFTRNHTAEKVFAELNQVKAELNALRRIVLEQ